MSGASDGTHADPIVDATLELGAAREAAESAARDAEEHVSEAHATADDAAQSALNAASVTAGMVSEAEARWDARFQEIADRITGHDMRLDGHDERLVTLETPTEAEQIDDVPEPENQVVQEEHQTEPVLKHRKFRRI